MVKQRLDVVLAERGLFPSRARAAASVMAGEVRVGSSGRRAAKPGELVDVEASLSVVAPARFVSRGGLKLDNALSACGLEVRRRRSLDVGASTGGFVDCLLQRGAGEVIAVDVGYGTLDYGLEPTRACTCLSAPTPARCTRACCPTPPSWPRSTCRSSR